MEASGTSQVAGTSTFTYDPEYRLLTAAYPNTANNETITYDPVGNRSKYTKGSTTLFYNVNAANRYTTTNTTSATGPVYEAYTYDKNGSLTNITGNRNLTLTWDAHNRASQIQVGAILPYSYQYDINSYRILKNLGATTSINNYYLENGKLESIYDNNGNVQAKYMRGSVIDEVVNGYQANGTAMTNYTYHHDSLESVLGQSGNTGTVVAAQGYTSFGSIVNASGSSNNTLKFTGREQDSETGLYYYRARYYDPLTGRFLSEDPIRSGINYYVYAGNNPINANDPSGLLCVGCIVNSPVWSNMGIALFNLNWKVDSNFEQALAVQYFKGNGADYIMSPDEWGNFVAGVNSGNDTYYDQGIGRYATIPEGNKPVDLYDFSPFFSLGRSAFNNAGTMAGGIVGYIFGGNSFYVYPPKNNNSSPNNSKSKQNTNQQSPTNKPSNSSSSGTPAANQAANAAAAAVNSAMDAVNSAINPPSVPQAAPTATLTTELIGFGEDAADGGFILYPNMSNTSQIQSVYSKH